MGDLPESVLETAARLTRQARAAADEGEAAVYLERRDDLLAEHEFRPRVREEAEGAVLVCYPEDWIADSGVVDPAGVDDTDRAFEIRLAGRGPQGEFEEADSHNRIVAERVRDRWGADHGANAEAFGDFMSNHYARRVETATETEIREFLEEYYPRNVWPSPEQGATVEQSLRYMFVVLDEPFPLD